MVRYCQLVMGPAGSGKVFNNTILDFIVTFIKMLLYTFKSTYCETIFNHCEAMKRTVKIVNLDPAAEYFQYPVTADIRDLIQLYKIIFFAIVIFYIEYIITKSFIYIVTML